VKNRAAVLPFMKASRDGERSCIAGRGPLQSIGVERFRVGGTSGDWKLLFGEWAELGEDLLAFEVLACTSCRRAEFRVPARRT